MHNSSLASVSFQTKYNRKVDSMATVVLKQGAILGTTGVNLDGGKFFKFLGIPYAKPPVGPLRFKAPQPPEPWTGTKDCTQDGNPSFGISFRTHEVVGSEDCLYLNVHTRSLPQPDSALKPVLFYIHGGAFTLGSGTQEMCDAGYFMTQDVVLVTINYRLGVFGFLSLEDSSLDVPGNAGLKDQTQALRWVQENIKQFNGDPGNVTIFGVSAGGASVQFQVLSPYAKGLFHKAIAQSGSVFNPWAWGQKNALQVVEKLGKTASSEAEALKILTEVDGEELFKATKTFPDCIIISDVRRPFGPVIEKPNPTAFLSENPQDILVSGKFNQVPLIQGLCSNEGLIGELGELIYIPKNFKPEEHLIPWNLNPKNLNFPKWKQAILELYYKNEVTKLGKHQHLGDTLFNIGVVESTKMALKHSKNPIYFYQFDYNTGNVRKFRKMLKVDDSITGMSHGGDQDFLFLMSVFGSNAPAEPDDVDGIKTVIGIWTDFARTGVPHPKWRPITNPQQLDYLRLAEELEMLKNPFEERIKVWAGIVEEAGGFDLTIDGKHEKSQI